MHNNSNNTGGVPVNTATRTFSAHTNALLAFSLRVTDDRPFVTFHKLLIQAICLRCGETNSPAFTM